MSIKFIKDSVFNLRLSIASIMASSNQDDLKNHVGVFDVVLHDLVEMLQGSSITTLCIELLGLHPSLGDWLMGRDPVFLLKTLEESTASFSYFSERAHVFLYKVNGIPAIKYNTQSLEEPLQFIESFTDNWLDVCLMHVYPYGSVGSGLRCTPILGEGCTFSASTSIL